MIFEASRTGAPFEVEGSERVLNVDLGRVIGVDQTGVPTSILRVVTDENGNVITAYPVR